MPSILKGGMYTRFIDDNVGALIAAQPDSARYFEPQGGAQPLPRRALPA